MSEKNKAPKSTVEVHAQIYRIGDKLLERALKQRPPKVERGIWPHEKEVYLKDGSLLKISRDNRRLKDRFREIAITSFENNPTGYVDRGTDIFFQNGIVSLGDFSKGVDFNSDGESRFNGHHTVVQTDGLANPHPWGTSEEMTHEQLIANSAHILSVIRGRLAQSELLQREQSTDFPESEK